MHHKFLGTNLFVARIKFSSTGDGSLRGAAIFGLSIFENSFRISTLPKGFIGGSLSLSSSLLLFTG